MRPDLRVLRAHIDFTNAVSLNVNVVDSILEALGHICPVQVHRLLNVEFIMLSDHRLEFLSEVRFHHYFVEVLLAHRHRFNLVDGHVEELRALVVERAIVIDGVDRLLLLADYDLLAVEALVKKAVSDSYRALQKKDDFKDLLVLILHNFPDVEAWLQSLDELDQELPVLQLSVLVIAPEPAHGQLVGALVGLEVPLVLVEEIIEQVIYEDLALNVVRKLIHESDILLSANCRKPVVVPVVVEEVLDFRDQLLPKRVTVVESGEQSYPLGEIPVVTYFPETFIVHQDLDELPHDEGKHSNSEE